MSTPVVVLLSAVVLLACASLGGGIYESVVLDPVWPGRPAIIQAQHGGVSRRRFWIPVHGAVAVALLAAVIVTWDRPDVRAPILIAVASHAAARIWSLVDLEPKVVAFQKADPAVIERDAAVRWTRRSLLRLPPDVVTCVAALTALVVAA